MEKVQSILDIVPVQCPKCGRMSDSIKCYSVPNYLVFIGVYAAYEFKKEVCCPHCMRKRLLIKYFTYNILIGNVLWLLLGLPMGIWRLCSSFTKGHSWTVKQILAENLNKSTTSAQSAPAPNLQGSVNLRTDGSAT